MFRKQITIKTPSLKELKLVSGGQLDLNFRLMGQDVRGCGVDRTADFPEKKQVCVDVPIYETQCDTNREPPYCKRVLIRYERRCS